MKNILFILGVTGTFLVTSLSADSLKNSLNNILQQKDIAGMVNLNGVGVGKPKPKIKRQVKKSRPGTAVIGRYNDGKAVYKKEANKYLKKVTKGKIKDLDLLPRKQRLLVLKDLQKMYAMKHFKGRPPSTIIATVNGKDIYKKEADKYLRNATKGKVKDFDRLDKKQRLVLIKDLAKPIVVAKEAENNITSKEKEAIFNQMWLEKQRAKMTVSSEEMQALYKEKKMKALASNPNAKIPPYISLGTSLKKELIEQKIMKDLMKNANIIINEEDNSSFSGIDSNKSVEKLDKIQVIKENK